MTSGVGKQDRWIARAGFVLGLAGAGVVALLPGELLELSVTAQRAAAIAVLMALWWMTEALPLPVTALLPLVLFPLADVLSADEAAVPYANKYVFLFLGGFMIARAVERWNLHRRIALLTVSAVGTQPRRLIGGFMLATAGLSMWISNTASTVMMLPIAVSLIALLATHDGMDAPKAEAKAEARGSSHFATCLLLGVAYSASIGGLATLVGTPTNLLLAGFAAENGLEIGFGRWMLAALPLTVVMLAVTWWLLTRVIFPIPFKSLSGGRELINRQLRDLGSPSGAEWTVLTVFGLTAAAWVLREPVTAWLAPEFPLVARVNDTIIALVGAIALFLLPVDDKGTRALDWKTASDLPWGVLLLFGGGFSLASGIEQSGLAKWIGTQVARLEHWPTLALVAAVVTLIVFLTELTSNTPTAATFLPVLFSGAAGLGVPPLLLLVPTTIAASCAFMLPVATPPNAIVFGSGHLTIRSMMRAGVWLNLVGIVVVTAWMYLWGQWILVPQPS